LAVRLKACVAAALLPRLRADWLSALDACQRGMLDSVRLDWDSRTAVNVALSTGGEGATPSPITGLDVLADRSDTFVWHQQTAMRDDRLVTAGPVPVSVTALGQTLSQARQAAYDAVECVRFEDRHYRKDIAAGGADER
jgi:phosphoribosylamine--glycine ligase